MSSIMGSSPIVAAVGAARIVGAAGIVGAVVPSDHTWPSPLAFDSCLGPGWTGPDCLFLGCRCNDCPFAG